MLDFLYADTPQALVSKINSLERQIDIINVLQSKNGGYLVFFKIK